jgi:hypothetical protein
MFLEAHDITVKGLFHEMDNLFEGLKIKSLLSVHAPVVLKLFCCLVMEKLDVTLWLASMKMKTHTYLYSKIVAGTHFKMVAGAFRKPPVTLKSILGTPLQKLFEFSSNIMHRLMEHLTESQAAS